MSKTDHAFIKTVKLLCPRVSEDDGRMIKECEISKFLNERQRSLVKSRLLNLNTLIPSIHSLFEDLYYLELLVNALKMLHRLRAADPFCRVSFQFPAADARPSDKTWRELFLYAMRNHYRIHKSPGRDGGSGDLNLAPDINELQLNHFAAYAFRLGFKKLWRPSLPFLTHQTGYDVQDHHRPQLATNEWILNAEEKRNEPPQKAFHEGCRRFL